MLQTETENTPILQADVMALDALFKRIAERGRKIRIQNQTSCQENIDGSFETGVGQSILSLNTQHENLHHNYQAKGREDTTNGK